MNLPPWMDRMNLGPASRGRADELDRHLDGRAGAARDSMDDEMSRLVELVGALRATPAPEPRPAFVADLRERLMAEAETVLAPSAGFDRSTDDVAARLTVAPKRSKRDRRVAVALGGFAVVTATTSMAVASQGSLPGETLYPLKRSIEDVRVAAQGSDADKGELLLEQARTRLSEVEQLTADGDGDEVAETLSAFTEQSEEASGLLLDDYDATSDESSVADLRAFTASSLVDLDALDDAVPADARSSLIDAARTIARIDGAAFYVCAACAPPLADVVDLRSSDLMAAGGIELPDVDAADLEAPAVPDAGPGSGEGPSRGDDRGGTRPGRGGDDGGSGNGNGSGNGGGSSLDEDEQGLLGDLGDTVSGLLGGGDGSSSDGGDGSGGNGGNGGNGSGGNGNGGGPKGGGNGNGGGNGSGGNGGGGLLGGLGDVIGGLLGGS